MPYPQIEDVEKFQTSKIKNDKISSSLYLFLMSVFCTSCDQDQTIVSKDIINFETKGHETSYGPNDMVRNPFNILQPGRDFKKLIN